MVKIGCSAYRWPVRRRETCGARSTTQELLETMAEASRELQIMDGRVGLFMWWADFIAEGGTLEDRRVEYRGDGHL